MMSHEKLDVYQLSIKFVSLARRIIKRIPRGNADLSDQLKRASRSIPLLIAEGVGKTTPAHQASLLATHEARHTNAPRIWMCYR
ncbi:MAG: four helix bundle protein [Gammaproteobacteria bacterium]|nr:four helix bundle protein [Gammaproteobacteria bacterium]